MIEDIGNTAGEIWRFLEQQTEPVNLTTLKKNVPISSSLLMMGLGWLAREDKVRIESSEASYKISIKY
jgi:hypothetical protein